MIKSICLILSMFSSIDECKLYAELPKYNTIVTDSELIDNLSATHIKVFGYHPNINRINMAWAQIAFENGRGSHIYNYNLGNIGLSDKFGIRPHYLVSGSKFLSFPSLQAGSVAYWETLKNMCSNALPYFDNGDALGASHALKKCGYYRADLDFYSRNLKLLFWEQSFKK